jgi:hypothetical protein
MTRLDWQVLSAVLGLVATHIGLRALGDHLSR